MSTRYTPTTITGGSFTALQISAELAKIQTALAAALSRSDASTANQMEEDFNLNGHSILNAKAGTTPGSLVTKAQLDAVALTPAEVTALRASAGNTQDVTVLKQQVQSLLQSVGQLSQTNTAQGTSITALATAQTALRTVALPFFFKGTPTSTDTLARIVTLFPMTISAMTGSPAPNIVTPHTAAAQTIPTSTPATFNVWVNSTNIGTVTWQVGSPSPVFAIPSEVVVARGSTIEIISADTSNIADVSITLGARR